VGISATFKKDMSLEEANLICKRFFEYKMSHYVPKWVFESFLPYLCGFACLFAWILGY